MSFRIGRTEITMDPAKAFPESMSWDGDRLAITGKFIPPDSDPDLKRRALNAMFRLHWSGYRPGDAVPVTATDDPTLDGLYYVQSMNWQPLPGDSLYPYATSYAAELVKVPNGFSIASNETTSYFAQRDTTYSNPVDQTGLSAIHSSYIHLESGQAGLRVARPVSDGGSSQTLAMAQSFPLTTVWEGRVPLADYYSGSCRVEVKMPDGFWYELVGRQIPAGNVAQAGQVRMTNGGIRVLWDDLGVITLEVWDGSTFDVVDTFRLQNSAGSPAWGAEWLTPAQIPVVSRNDPEGVALTYVTRQLPTYPNSSFNVSLHLMRGDRHIDVHHPQTDIAELGSEASTAAVDAGNNTNAVERSADSATGHKWVIGTPGNYTQDLTNGRLLNNTALPSPAPANRVFCLGAIKDGSSAVTDDTGRDIVAQFWTGKNEQERATG